MMALERIVHFDVVLIAFLSKKKEKKEKSVMLIALWNFVSWFWTFRVREKLLGHSQGPHTNRSEDPYRSAVILLTCLIIDHA